MQNLPDPTSCNENTETLESTRPHSQRKPADITGYPETLCHRYDSIAARTFTALCACQMHDDGIAAHTFTALCACQTHDDGIAAHVHIQCVCSDSYWTNATDGLHARSHPVLLAGIFTGFLNKRCLPKENVSSSAGYMHVFGCS